MLLKNRRRQANETFLDKARTVEYVIEGVPDSKFNMSIVYQDRNIEV